MTQTTAQNKTGEPCLWSRAKAGLAACRAYVKDNTLSVLIVLCCIFGLALAVPVSRFFGAAVFLLGLTAAFEIWRYRMPFKYCPQRVFAISMFLAVCWLSAFFSEYTDEATSRAIKLSAYALSCITVFAALRSRVYDLSQKMVGGVVAAFVIGCAVLMFEVHSNYMLHNFIRGDSLDTWVNPHSANPGGIILVILMWPILALLLKGGRKAVAAVLFILCLVIAFKTSSETAQIGLMLGGLAAVIASLVPKRLFFAGFTLLWSLGMALTPWIAQALFAIRPKAILKGSLIGDPAASGGHRLEIWDGVARLALEKPVFGHGLGSTKFLQLDIDGEFFPLLEATHPHNMPLELWVDFGLVGVAIGTLVPVYVASRIQQYSGALYFAMTGCFATVLVISLSGHGAWQSWWLGAIIVAAFLLKFTALRESADKAKS